SCRPRCVVHSISSNSLTGWKRPRKEVSMSPKKDTQKSTKSATVISKTSKGFTDEERAAMKERAQELKAEERANKNKADGEGDVLAKIAAMHEPDRAMAKRLHAIIKASAPALSPKSLSHKCAPHDDGRGEVHEGEVVLRLLLPPDEQLATAVEPR